mmetsp:Transcript_42855/g.46543  ORF Transcript_42855/g.46543 Transcript_42855/m.46543 type:complete len:586 (-) Transcript_42855:241-1998(-)
MHFTLTSSLSSLSTSASCASRKSSNVNSNVMMLLMMIVAVALLSSSSSSSCPFLWVEASSAVAASPPITTTTTTTSVGLSSSLSSHKKKQKRLTLDTMNAKLRKMEYAVRGEVVIAADRINAELQQGDNDNDNDTITPTKKYQFDKIVYTNIGNPQSVGQPPLTWPRQVLALVDLPDADGVDHPDATKLFPIDAIRRAKEIKKGMGGSGSGAYSHSKGLPLFREDVVGFLQQRDGDEVPTDAEQIFLSNGASAAISNLLTALIADSTCGVMTPIPQYPIYSATIDLLGGRQVGYYLDEENQWNLNIPELERSLQEAKDQGTNVVGFVLINPGNPTGGVLSKQAVQEVVQFCATHNLVLLADEVYQENVYDDTLEFYSCKRAAYDLGLLQSNDIELASFHSTSKGVYGECGRRGGYMELTGFDPLIEEQLYKLASASLCSSLNGQCMTSLMCRGPAVDEVSYHSHQAEQQQIFTSLKRRAKIVEQGLDAIEGFSCQPAQGAMYCFPRVDMPPKAIVEAQRQNTTPDTLYALSLLQRTGIVVVPASGFGQEDHRYGFRTTFLPSEQDMTKVVQDMKLHHDEFCQKYS